MPLRKQTADYDDTFMQCRWNTTAAEDVPVYAGHANRAGRGRSRRCRQAGLAGDRPGRRGQISSASGPGRKGPCRRRRRIAEYTDGADDAAGSAAGRGLESQPSSAIPRFRRPNDSTSEEAGERGGCRPARRAAESGQAGPQGARRGATKPAAATATGVEVATTRPRTSIKSCFVSSITRSNRASNIAIA